jgi:hypothetical protein
MFDTIRQVTEHVTKNVNITEHRAPTDESVRLLKELEEKAQQKIIDSIRVADTNFECVVHCLDDFKNSQYILFAKFSMNGHAMETNVKIDRYKFKEEEFRYKAWEALRKAVADQISNLLLTAFSAATHFPKGLR